jgi:hypothetical protein
MEAKSSLEPSPYSLTQASYSSACGREVGCSGLLKPESFHCQPEAPKYTMVKTLLAQL